MKMNAVRNRNVGVFIDDTGTPGVQSPSPHFLHESRKSWAAVVLPPTIADQVYSAMEIVLEGVELDYGAKELHFTDIYSGRGVWSGIEVDERVRVFDAMGLIFEEFGIPVFYQTWSEEFRADATKLFNDLNGTRIGWWDLENVSHFGLIKLLYSMMNEIKKELRRESAEFDSKFPVVVDEGLLQKGRTVSNPWACEGVFEDDLVFASSKDSVGLQLADFAAFLISRTQWIQMKKRSGENYSDADKHLLNLLHRLDHRTINFHILETDEKSVSGKDLESVMMKDRIHKGLSPVPKIKE